MRSLPYHKLWQKYAICLVVLTKCNFGILSNSKANQGLMNCNSYGRMLKRISTVLSPPEQATVKRIFSWLICTRRPLRTVELEHALLIQPGDNDLQHTRALYKDVRELCGPIVEVRKEYITFVHFSAKEYTHTQTFARPQFSMLNHIP